MVEIGKQMLMTRGVLTTFSIANDVAKYFAIIPAMFMGVYPEIAPLNIMHLASPQSAILSAVIFNAIIIILLIPLALARRAVSPHRRRPVAGAFPVDLWRRRSRRAVYRYQTDRFGFGSRRTCLGEIYENFHHRFTRDHRYPWC